MTRYLDFHTHRLRRVNDTHVDEIISIHLGKDTEHTYYTIGKHPWWTDEIITDNERKILEEHLRRPECIAMGEMGLDNLKGPEISLQMDILRSQLDVANQLNKPVIIHCVRAINQLLVVKKEFPKINNWCIHGYARHATLAKQLIDQGFYLSLMPLAAMNNKRQALLDTLPADRFFLETDSMPNIKIENAYLQTATALDIPIDDLKQQMLLNAKIFFGYE